MNRRTFISGVGATLTTILAAPSSDYFVSKLAKLPPFPFARIKYSSGNWDTDSELATVFYESIQRFTSLRTERKEHQISLDSKEVFAFPFVFITGNHNFRLSEQERDNFRQYVFEGGLVFVDDCNHDVQGPFAESFEYEMNRLFTSEQSLRMLENDSSIYSCYFKFSDGPPTTSQELNGWGDKKIHTHLKAISVKDNIGVLYSNKDYGCEWTDRVTKKGDSKFEATFGVNIAVYAMLQKYGSQPAT